MKKLIVIIIFAVVAFFSTDLMAQTYKYSGRSGYGSSYNSYKSPSKGTRNYKNGGQIYMQKGYTRKNGTYVRPHLKTRPDNYKWNNLGNR